MKPRPQSLQRRLAAGLVRQAAERRAPLLATSLWDYARAEGLSWSELAASLGCSEAGLDRIALCRPPREEQFMADAAVIAAGVVAPDRLVPLLRRLQVLGALAGLPRGTAMTGMGEAAPTGVLLAAREDDEPEGGEEEPDRREGDAPDETPADESSGAAGE